MAKNLGRKFATMDEDERREFAGQEEGGTRDVPAELEFDLEDEQQRRAVEDEARRRVRQENDST